MSAAAAETLADVVQRLGNVNLSRIRMHPAPGTATTEDVARIRDREKRLFELVDGVLVEKAMGFRQSLIALLLGRLLGNFVNPKNLGLVVGADGMLRLFPDTVRIPDVAFIAWDRLPGGRVPVDAVPSVAPTLVIEVLSDSNTAGEMARKRADYFASGVELVWEVDIDLRTVAVYSSPDNPTVLVERNTLTGDPVLSSFRLPLRELFAELDRTQQLPE